MDIQNGIYREMYYPLSVGGVRFMTVDKTWHETPDIWDIIIAHPPCTYLTVAGNRYFDVDKYGIKAYGRFMDRLDGIRFFMEFTCCNARRIAIENPIGIMSSVYRKPDQIIQPYEFGHPVSKATCLWLKNLPKLEPTNIVDKGETDKYGYSIGGPMRYATDNNGKIIPWNDPRTAVIRSKTFPGIARAMALQWAGENKEENG